MEIFGLIKTQYPYDVIIGENKIDITRNRELIQVFYSIIKTNDWFEYYNQNNNFSSNWVVNGNYIHTYIYIYIK